MIKLTNLSGGRSSLLGCFDSLFSLSLPHLGLLVPLSQNFLGKNKYFNTVQISNKLHFTTKSSVKLTPELKAITAPLKGKIFIIKLLLSSRFSKVRLQCPRRLSEKLIAKLFFSRWSKTCIK